MIEATPNTTGNLKYDALFLFNDEIQSKNDEQNFEKYGRYEVLKTVLDCNKFRTLIKRLFGLKINVLSKTELDNA